jgi:hypothetical protein
VSQKLPIYIVLKFLVVNSRRNIRGKTQGMAHHQIEQSEIEKHSKQLLCPLLQFSVDIIVSSRFLSLSNSSWLVAFVRHSPSREKVTQGGSMVGGRWMTGAAKIDGRREGRGRLTDGRVLIIGTVYTYVCTYVDDYEKRYYVVRYVPVRMRMVLCSKKTQSRTAP